jgi:hypothetical protein
MRQAVQRRGSHHNVPQVAAKTTSYVRAGYRISRRRSGAPSQEFLGIRQNHKTVEPVAQLAPMGVVPSNHDGHPNEEWWVEAETAEEARQLLAAGDGYRCHGG